MTKIGYKVHIIQEPLFNYRMYEKESLAHWAKENKSQLLTTSDALKSVISENNELISIFVKSVKTAESNR